MSLSVHQVSQPVFVQLLGGFTTVLEKAANHCADHKIEETTLLKMRLYPNMFHMARQAALAINFSAGALARMAGREVPDFGNDEASFADLRERVGKALEYIQEVTPADLEGCEDRAVDHVTPSRTRTFPGRIYLLHYAMPQFTFHIATGYDILRHAGVVIGKSDFMGNIPAE